MTEIWKPVKGLEGYYEVSNTGKIRSLLKRYKEKGVFELKLETTNKGYYRVQLSVPIRAKKSVHRAVAEAFIPNPDNKPFVNHKDNNRQNNCINNLEWCTQSENLKHAQNQGRLLEAQAAGGKITAKALKAKAKEEAFALVGTKINSWKVIEYVGLTGTANRETLLCMCNCGFKQNIESHRLKSGKATMCRACAKKEAREQAYYELIEVHLTTYINNWYIAGVSPLDIEKPVRATKFKVVCRKCGNKDTLPQPAVIGSKPVKPCSNCKK